LLTAAAKSNGPTLTQVIPPTKRGNYVTAVASLGDDVFVLRLHSHRIEVYMYDATSFTLQRHIVVPGLHCPLGLAACAYHKCLYVSDSAYHSIHRAELSDGQAVKKWSVAARGPRGLSVNEAHNVVVVCHEACKILEYTTHGELVREISLQARVADPWHAVQLSSDHYVVSEKTSPGVVSVVGVDGQVVCQYPPSQTADVGKISAPMSLAVAKNGDILVADSENDRLILIHSSLSYAEELILPIDGKIRGTSGFCLDDSRDRLYIGENSGKYGVLVFGNLFDFTTKW